MRTRGTASETATTVSGLEWLLAVAIGMLLAAGVWRGLLTGGGLVGGDTYPYFMPQKQLMAEEFQRGQLPLWHDRTGLGYPLLAESQAGVLYPTNQILYRLLDVNAAYNASLLLHYLLGFVFAWRFARSQQLSCWSALLAALVYVYGWFPARVSLEWSMIGGVWLPLTLWLTDRLLHRPSARLFAVLAACLGIHLLAGHFALAFINQLTLLLYAGLRSWLKRDPQPAGQNSAQQVAAAAGDRLKSRFRPWAVTLVPAAIGVSLLLAATQLLPTYELKRTSQREGVNKAFNPAYGHLPPLYISQLVASWTYWHTPEVLLARQMLQDPLAIAADTNPVEAHLYWGLIPLGLICLSLLPHVRQQLPQTSYRTWMILSLLGLIYATGWLLPVTRLLPGFTWFMGPARYTIVTALGGGVISGMVLDFMLKRRRRFTRPLVTVAVGLITLADLLTASRYVADAVIVEVPPLTRLPNSWLREYFTSTNADQLRLLAPGPNVGNLYGVSCVPTYLGLGPAFYYGGNFQLAATPESPQAVFPSAEEVVHLRSLGVTHLLTERPIANPAADLQLINSAPDALLNSLWGRGLAACWLYQLQDPPQRVVTEPAAGLHSWMLRTSQPKRIEFDITLKQDCRVILRSLMFPGWQVQVNGQVQPAAEDIYRTVQLPAGTHHVSWQFRPASVRTGAWISLLTIVALTAVIIIPAVRRDRRQTAGPDKSARISGHTAVDSTTASDQLD